MSEKKETTGSTEGTRHVFEHLGEAPYRFVGHEAKTYQACPGAPIQVGGSCDHCGTGIIDHFFFVSADGQRFKVGSSCVQKAGDKGMYRQIERDVNRIKRERKQVRDQERIAAAIKKIESLGDVLKSEPHPMGFTNRQTGEPLTLGDWCEWMLANSGTAGKLKVARAIEKLRAAPF